jgi:hypothetical protein
MLDEIHAFFDGLRSKPKPVLSSVGHPMAAELRATLDENWRLLLEVLDGMEASLLEIYEAGADDPAAIDFFDKVLSIIRRRDQSDDNRISDIGKLLLASRPLPRKPQ